MENIKDILAQLNRQFLGGAKIPHGMSNPVLRKSLDRYVIATFFYTYKKEHLDSKRLLRPKYWMVAEINSGELIKEISCQETDFSKQPFDEFYSLEKPESIKLNSTYFDEMFKLFDEVRESLISSGTLDSDKYSAYMDMMLAVVPPSYHIFYHELSEGVQS